MGEGVNDFDDSLGRRDLGPHDPAMTDWIACAPFERLLSLRIESAADGRAVLSMPFQYEYAQGMGFMHGGALISLADTAVVMAIKSVLAPGSRFVTRELSSRFLRPVRQGVVRARASIELEGGRRINGRARVEDEQGREVLVFSSTFSVLDSAQSGGDGP
jgi:uncharacterized protein (TIGR00369 family)